MNNYDEQIKHLTENPQNINIQWELAQGLFKCVGKSLNAGCLTMIRRNPETWKAIINGKVNQNLTEQIANDERLPKDAESIIIEHLPVFKEWQEHIDNLENETL